MPKHDPPGDDATLKVLDLVCQVAGKPWADDGCLAGLVRCLNDLLQPQAHLCSMGADRRLHGDEIMRMAQRAREQVNISSKPACSFTPECFISRNGVPGSGVMPVLRAEESRTARSSSWPTTPSCARRWSTSSR